MLYWEIYDPGGGGREMPGLTRLRAPSLAGNFIHPKEVKDLSQNLVSLVGHWYLLY